MTKPDRLQDLANLISSAYGMGHPDKATVRQLGGWLAEVFSSLPRGKFGKWVEANTKIPVSDAYNYKWWSTHDIDKDQLIKELRDRVRKLEIELELLRK